MKTLNRLSLLTGWILLLSVPAVFGQAPTISGNSYGQIAHTGVTLHWATDIPADSRVFWMVSDSNDQPVVYTDSLRISDLVTAHAVPVSGLQPAVMYRYSVVSVAAGGSDTAYGFFITQSLSSGKITAWFNHTVDTSVSTGVHANGTSNFQKLIEEQISKATHSIDLTTWDFDQMDSVVYYLIRAKERGVRIRFVYDYTPLTPNMDTLVAHGIRVVQRPHTPHFTMHNKFLIFDHRNNSNPDNQYLWTGSTNITHTQFHSDRNNIIILQDQSLCEVYTREFEEMWGSHTDLPDTARSRFGPEKRGELAHRFNLAGTPVEAYFAPTDSITDTLVALVSTRPVKSIYFCMLKFTIPALESALHQVYSGGIGLSGVFDSSCSIKTGSAFPLMKGYPVAGAWNPAADVFLDTIPGLLHHKYSLIDADTVAGDKIVTTGSFNWEIPAQTGNDENMLVIHSAAVSNLYFQEFMARYRESGGTALGGPIGAIPPGEPAGNNSIRVTPNPFDDLTSLRLSLGHEARVIVEIYDPFGKTIAILDRGVLSSGLHQVSINGDGLPKGLLLCRVNIGDRYQILKLIHSPE